MIEISIIIALAMSINPFLSEKLNIPKKLSGWSTILMIIIFNIGNSLLFGDQQVIEAIKVGIEAGTVAVGIYSTGKNTIQYVKDDKNKDY